MKVIVAVIGVQEIVLGETIVRRRILVLKDRTRLERLIRLVPIFLPGFVPWKMSALRGLQVYWLPGSKPIRCAWVDWHDKEVL